ncbi:UDP-Glycosyltransferase/glycogen phosphorylase [Basidiobolus meristosporus CBS 931.73]|uniref:UDP-Glycosyltransferase/glycogen phosphorylase n=1 Tax=Basidiobolus meristosporus CBS 931.73 TaxID=1314790 RepID=A0A1Y1YTF6_9FUNG|nr:UDP-Glycosyltransferase/glycogen phosphorylase [Basidiobolus meristosporus CBS 931.73]|eukprot:ORY01239.1 UDP-Glycosyltransferase/glycogen phosphorylase [Basidiobolus meristosporus CBS 931.73]
MTFIISLVLSVLLAMASGHSLHNETWRQPGKIIISSHFGGYSHAKPIFQIASVLKQRGYEVSYASFTPFMDLAKPWGFRRIAMGDGPLTADQIKETMKNATRDHDRKSIVTAVAVLWQLAYIPSYRQLTRIFSEEKPSFVMCDVFNFGCIDAAHHLRIPFSIQMPSLGILHSISDSITNSLDIGTVAADSGIITRFNRNFKHRLEYLWNNWRFAQLANKDRIKAGSVARQEFGFNNIDKGVIFVNSFFGIDLLDDGAIDGVIWPISASAIEEFPDEVYISNATIPVDPILKNQHENVRILNFAPQFSVLSHPSTVLFVSHGGLDSSNEALLTGTRVLNIPTFGDHFYNAANLQTSGEMVEKAKLLLEDKDGQFASNVRRMQILAQINSKRIQYAADVAEQMVYRW